MAVIVAVLFLAIAVTCTETAETSTLRTIALDNGKYNFHWRIDGPEIIMEVYAQTLGWVGLGFSPQGGMIGADIAIGGVKDGKPYLNDYHAFGNEKPVLDEQQNYKLLSASENGTHTYMKFKRLLDTCDPEDWKINDDTVRLIWAYNSMDIIDKVNFDKHTDRGTKSVMLLNEKTNSKTLSMDGVQTIDLRLDKVHVPGDYETSYFCKIFNLNITGKVHMIKYEPILEEHRDLNIHHIVVFKCSEKAKKYVNTQSECYGQDEMYGASDLLKYCFIQFVATWTTGGEAVSFPEDVGYPIIENESSFMLMEVHYDNQKFTKGVIDNSGIRFYITTRLRKYESEQTVFTAGMNANYIVLPPNVDKLTFSATCDYHCTQFFPKEGVRFFNTLLHAHMKAKGLRLRHIRDNVELKPIIEDNNYDFNYQNSRILKEHRLVLPNDTIIFECDYETIGATSPTFGGMKTNEEMCAIFVDYYPKTDAMVSCYGGPAPVTMAMALGANFDSSNLTELDPFLYPGQNGLIKGPFGQFNNIMDYALAIKWNNFTCNKSKFNKKTMKFDINRFQNILYSGPQYELCTKSGQTNFTQADAILNYVKSLPYPRNFKPYIQEKVTCENLNHINFKSDENSGTTIEYKKMYVIKMLVFLILNIIHIISF